MRFSNIFDKLGRMLTGRSPLIFFLPFLYKGQISACLGISGNAKRFIELLKLLQRKLLRMSVFSFKTDWVVRAL